MEHKHGQLTSIRRDKGQWGFGALEAFLILIVIGALATIGWLFIRHAELAASNQSASSIASAADLTDAYFTACNSDIANSSSDLTLSQDFTTNADTSSWATSPSGISFSASGLTSTASDPGTAAWATSKARFVGDLEIEANLTSFSSLQSSSDYSGVFVLKAITQKSDFFQAVIGNDKKGSFVSVGGLVNGIYLSSSRLVLHSENNLMLKLQRVGSVVTLYINNAKIVDFTSATTDPVSVGIATQNLSLRSQTVTSVVPSIRIVGCQKI